MKVVVLYDIDTGDASGRKRLTRVAKKCLDWGVRIQDSVYECEVNAAQFRDMIRELSGMINNKLDSLRFYNLGNHSETRITCIGRETSRGESNYIL